MFASGYRDNLNKDAAGRFLRKTEGLPGSILFLFRTEGFLSFFVE